MKTAILAIILALVYCGQIKAQEVEDVESQYLPSEGKNKYKIPLPEVPEWRDPIISGDWMCWTMESIDNAQNGFYHFEITAYNGPILFYWNNKEPTANKYLNPNFPGYDPTTQCILYYLKDGKVYTEKQESISPGENGDHLIRWTDNHNGTVTYFCNNADIGADVSNPFVIHSASSPNEWWKNKISQTLTDASGWGSVIIDKKNNTYYEGGSNSKFIEIAYGAYKSDGTEAYPIHFYDSHYLNEKRTGFKPPLPW
ncbi:hypothetical protein IPN41_02030 [Candidatus Falkowbacteria bacterium]|nr:MAG: hypothetical protein IPN41_02030 [Candidatus Falkowbacteria bacterium]